MDQFVVDKEKERVCVCVLVDLLNICKLKGITISNKNNNNQIVIDSKGKVGL